MIKKWQLWSFTVKNKIKIQWMFWMFCIYFTNSICQSEILIFFKHFIFNCKCLMTTQVVNLKFIKFCLRTMISIKIVWPTKNNIRSLTKHIMQLKTYWCITSIQSYLKKIEFNKCNSSHRKWECFLTHEKNFLGRFYVLLLNIVIFFK